VVSTENFISDDPLSIVTAEDFEFRTCHGVANSAKPDFEFSTHVGFRAQGSGFKVPVPCALRLVLPRR